jgi:hypothetical protein
MDRRTFLRETFMGLGVAACGVGGMWLRRTRSRGQFVSQLMDAARPILDAKALSEQETIPAKARDKIHEYFDGLILNANDGFLAEVRSPPFRAKLKALKKDDRRHQEVMAAFFRNVAGDADIQQHIRDVARELGPKLDTHWTECCHDIAIKWESRLHSGGIPFDPQSFAEHVTPEVRSRFEHAVKGAQVGKPNWRDHIRSLGEEALEEGRDINLQVGDHLLRVPEFWARASRKVFSEVLKILGDTKADCQEALSRRLALLGREVASEFEKEMHDRLNKLHTWQEQAVRLAAEQQAGERVGFFGENA